MVTLKASKLTLAEVQTLLNFEEEFYEGSIESLLRLETITETERLALWQIQQNFRPYLAGKASEGQVKALTTFPLLELAGFYESPLQLNIEEDIEQILIQDEDKVITGRFDIVAVNRATEPTAGTAFWVLVIEAKECGIEVRQGLAQLLTYAYPSLQHQPSVWGLVTNGLRYEFVKISRGQPSRYQILPDLNLMYRDSSIQLLQVLKAICRLQTAI